MLKKVITSAMIAGMIGSALAFPGFANDEPVLPITVTGIEQEETDMLPVRQIAEHFGYAVGWQAEGSIVSLTKGAQYITFAAGQDAYTFAKTAPESLGAPSVIVKDTTHVPVLFFTKLLGLNCHEVAENEYKVVLPSRAEITEIQEDGRLLIQDEFLGEVVVAITEETKLVANGEAISADVLAQGQAIMIEYGDAMAQSLPPQGTAVQITVLNLPVEEETEESVMEEGIAFAGTIQAVEEGMVTIVSDETGEEVCLMISEETQITKGLDRRIYKIDDLAEGMRISGLHSEAITMSLPPQTLALTINIEPEEGITEAVKVPFSGVIEEIPQEGRVLISTETDQILLMVSEETVIKSGNDKRIYGFDDLTVGTKISGFHAEAMTMSLPPQTLALEIDIQKAE
ncbi:MAG: copper amine oxidase N-terminal domain-containing protein [Ruminococcaceae bacterium]|nr:copper amine oxidase N-terminal domain-containing protein [Oscillospiraceae bacterium]